MLDSGELDALEVADYVQDLAGELANLAERAGLFPLSAALRSAQAHAGQALKDQASRAVAPEDAA